MNVYLISGLGADERAFERLHFPAGYSIHYLPWITPQKNESLNSYAARLAAKIDQAKPFALVGLSMGGMIAAAMNSFLKPHKTILISSAGSRIELPLYFRWCGRLKLYKLIPTSLATKPNPLAYWLFGAATKTEQTLMANIIKGGDALFIKWAIGAILTWRELKKPANVFHIHGSRDKILPVRNVKPDAIVKGGSHFMIWTNAVEVSALIQQALVGN